MNIWKMNVPNSVCNGPNSVKKLVNLIPKSIKNVFVVIDKNIESTDFSKKIKELLLLGLVLLMLIPIQK